MLGKYTQMLKGTKHHREDSDISHDISDDSSILHPKKKIKTQSDLEALQSLITENNPTEPSDFERSCIRWMWHRHNPKLNVIGRLGDGIYGPPRTVYNTPIPNILAQPSNKRILKTILSICADKKGPYVIPTVIDHWTTSANFSTVIQSGAFLGNAFLKKKLIEFTPNALGGPDLENLDSNVICFCPGGFVDPLAVKNKDGIRLRINLKNVNLTGRYNAFFKITDLCFPKYSITVKLTDSLSVTLGCDRGHFYGPSTVGLTFNFNGKEICIAFGGKELVYYGGLEGINRFCLLLPFMALENLLHGKGCRNPSEQDKELASLICRHLLSLGDDELRKVLICLAQNITMCSESNFYCKLPLSSKLIYDIHDITNGKTYSLDGCTSEQYDSILKELSNSTPLDAALSGLPQKNESIIEFSENGQVIIMNNINFCTNSFFKFENDIRNLPNNQFRNGYIETRVGNRSVPSISYEVEKQASTTINQDIDAEIKKSNKALKV